MKQLLNLRKKEQKRTIKVDFEATKDKDINNIVETTGDVVKGEEPLKQDAEDLFIYDDDDLFSYDEITPEDKKVNMYIIDQTDFHSDEQILNGDEDARIETIDENTEIEKENEQDNIKEGEKTMRQERR